MDVLVRYDLFFRFIAADDKVMFAISMESLVDFFTVPPVFLAGKTRQEHIVQWR